MVNRKKRFCSPAPSLLCYYRNGGLLPNAEAAIRTSASPLTPVVLSGTVRVHVSFTSESGVKLGPGEGWLAVPLAVGRARAQAGA